MAGSGEPRSLLSKQGQCEHLALWSLESLPTLPLARELSSGCGITGLCLSLACVASLRPQLEHCVALYSCKEPPFSPCGVTQVASLPAPAFLFLSPRGFHLTCHPPSFPVPPGDGYVQADARGPHDYEEHLYVNTQGLDVMESEDMFEAPLLPEDSPKKDLFDMRAWPVPHLTWDCMGAVLGNPEGRGPRL